MSLRAIAFHEAVSAKELEELFKSEWHQLVATTKVGRCHRCGARYAVFLADKDDAQNEQYLTDLENRISQSCSGKHSETQIRLDVA